MLKQFLVFGQKDLESETEKRKAYFIMATCAQNARQEFRDRFKLEISQCMQVADSSYTKEDLTKHDFWKEKVNRELPIPDRVESEGQKRYFLMKAKAEKVQAAKKRVGVTDWDTMTDDQYSRLLEILKA